MKEKNEIKALQNEINILKEENAQLNEQLELYKFAHPLDYAEKENIFGSRLKYFREFILHLSQKDFANKSDIQQSTLSLYETGKTKPTIDVIIKLSEKYDISADWLIGKRDGFDWRINSKENINADLRTCAARLEIIKKDVAEIEEKIKIVNNLENQ